MYSQLPGPLLQLRTPYTLAVCHIQQSAHQVTVTGFGPGRMAARIKIAGQDGWKPGKMGLGVELFRCKKVEPWVRYDMEYE